MSICCYVTQTFTSDFSKASLSGFDPLGLVWGAEVMRSHTLGADVAEVFVCSPSAGPEPMSMSEAVSLVAQAGGLFERLPVGGICCSRSPAQR